jgi:uncharacterized membrane protein (DUF485 family)
MQTNVHKQLHDKRKARSLIHFFYTLQHWAFQALLSIIALLFVVILIGLITLKTFWGAWLLSSVVPWSWIFSAALLLGFLFIFTDTFIQAQEERWFRRYGTRIMATVTAIEEVHPMKWRRRFFLNTSECRLKLAWTHPQSEKVYVYERRVRAMTPPMRGTQIPVIIDFDDPAYFFPEDFKRPY